MEIAAQRRKYFNSLKKHIALLGGTADKSDINKALRRIIFPGNLVEGKFIKKYEKAFASYIGADNAVSFSAGRVGLYGIMKALGIGKDDEVLLQVPTHVVVANAIKYLGARPVYVDCSPKDFNINIDLADKKITGKTKAIILQHTFGIPADIKRTTELSKKHNLAVIEDCVHSLGAEYKKKKTGSFGDASFFSTEETKVISTTMGGIASVNPSLINELLEYQKMCTPPPFFLSYKYILKFFLYHFLLHPGIHRSTRSMYEFFGEKLPLPRPTNEIELRGEMPPGYFQRLSNAQAEIGLNQLKRISKNLSHRRKIAEIYKIKLIEYGIKPVYISPDADPSFVRYPLLVRNKQHAIKEYKNQGVLGTWFNSVLEEAVDPELLGYQFGTNSIAERAVKHLINLPTHERVTEEDAERLIESLKDNLISADDIFTD